MPRALTKELLVKKCEQYFDLYPTQEQEIIRVCKQKLYGGDSLTDDEIDALSDLADRF